ncbi:trypsin-like cysteine/serine peptidase domain-containing protein, partial [Helicostylum pulchrum]
NPILCGGSIISLDPPWILTAAHCIEDFNIADEVSASVAYGSRKFSEQSYAQIKRAISHPLYVPSSIQLKAQVYATDKTDQVPYDIGLIELTLPFVETDHVNRVRIYMEEGGENVDNKLETIGMGYTGIQEPHANVLQYAYCNLSNAAPLHDNNFNNSIILVASDAGLCHGDSGSPLLYKPDDSSEYSLKGVLNRILNAFDPDPENITCPLPYSSTAGFLNIFAKPSRHINWITSVTGLSESTLTD